MSVKANKAIWDRGFRPRCSTPTKQSMLDLMISKAKEARAPISPIQAINLKFLIEDNTQMAVLQFLRELSEIKNPFAYLDHIRGGQIRKPKRWTWLNYDR